MAAQPGRGFRFRRPVGVRPVMLRAGLALALLTLALVAMKAKADVHAPIVVASHGGTVAEAVD